MAEKTNEKTKTKTSDAAAAKAGDAPVKSSKKKFLIIGGVVGIVAVAFLASLMAVPKHEHAAVLEGPFVATLTKTEIQANLAGENGKRYVVMGLTAEYYAYSQAYVQGRLGGKDEHGGVGVEDPLYLASLKDALLTLASNKTLVQVTDPALVDAFLEDVLEAVNPVLFPVCIGDAMTPQKADTHSGVRVGESIYLATMRGLLHEHKLEVNAPAKTIALDDGAPVTFEPHNRDLRVDNKTGQFVFVDMTRVLPTFVGSVPVGSAGRIRRIFKDSFLVQ